jgi:hypothetical protein
MQYAVWILGLLLGGFVGFLAGYMKKKGENLATHEDISKLVDQVRAVTTATKEIEAKISSDVWDRQKQWELKREVLFQAVQRISEVEDALLSIDSALQVELIGNKEGQPGWLEAKVEKKIKWSKASAAFDETRLLVGIVCGKETTEAFESYGSLTNIIAGEITKKNSGIYKKSQSELISRYSAVRTALRKELEIYPPAGFSCPAKSADQPAASEGQATSAKTGASPSQLALGFCLGTVMTVAFSLITWGSGPTPRRLLFSLGVMFLCASYLVWRAANRMAERFFRANRTAAVASGCAAILILALGATLWGRELWPKPPLFEMRISPSGFPVSIPPHSLVSILRIHPYIPLTDSADWLLKDSNDSGKEFFWPSQQEIDSKPPDDVETVYRVEIINHSSGTLLSGKLSLQLQYSPGASSGCTPSANSDKQEDVVLMPQLDPGRSFEFYAINQSAFCAWVIPPSTAAVRMASDTAERQVPLTFDKNPLYNSGAPSFMPTKIKWEGLPITPGPHYQIQRITH